MPAPIPEVQELHALMFANNLRPTHMLRAVGISPASWTRWTNGSDPGVSRLRAVRERVELEIKLKQEMQAHGRETIE